MDAPCKNCKDRHKNCHSECEKYIAFRNYKLDYYENKTKYSEIVISYDKKKRKKEK